MISGQNLQINNNSRVYFSNHKILELQYEYFTERVKNQDIRSILSSKEIQLLKEEARSFYKDTIFIKLNTLNDNNKRTDIKNKIISFNKICNIVMRKQVHHHLEFNELLLSVTSISQDLNLTTEEKEKFIIATIFINFHTNRGMYIKGVLKLITVSLLILLVYSIFALIATLITTLIFWLIVPLNDAIMWSIIVIGIYMLFELGNIISKGISGQGIIEEINKNFNIVDSLDSYTKSFKNILKNLFNLDDLQSSHVISNSHIIELSSNNNLLHDKFYDRIIDYSNLCKKTNINILNTPDKIQENNEIINKIITAINTRNSNNVKFLYNNKQISFSYEEAIEESERTIRFNQNISLALYDPINFNSLVYNNSNDAYWIIIRQPNSSWNNKYFYGFYQIESNQTVEQFMSSISNRHPLTIKKITSNDIFSVEDFLNLCI